MSIRKAQHMYVFCKHTHLHLTRSIAIAKQRLWKYKVLVAALAKYNDYQTHLCINRFVAKQSNRKYKVVVAALAKYNDYLSNFIDTDSLNWQSHNPLITRY